MLLGPEKPYFCNKNAQNSTFEASFGRGPKNVEILIFSEKMFFSDIFFENFESFWKIEFQIRARAERYVRVKQHFFWYASFAP